MHYQQINSSRYSSRFRFCHGSLIMVQQKVVNKMDFDRAIAKKPTSGAQVMFDCYA